jgi:hypothetical protein
MRVFCVLPILTGLHTRHGLPCRRIDTPTPTPTYTPPAPPGMTRSISFPPVSVSACTRPAPARRAKPRGRGGRSPFEGCVFLFHLCILRALHVGIPLIIGGRWGAPCSVVAMSDSGPAPSARLIRLLWGCGWGYGGRGREVEGDDEDDEDVWVAKDDWHMTVDVRDQGADARAACGVPARGEGEGGREPLVPPALCANFPPVYDESARG